MQTGRDFNSEKGNKLKMTPIIGPRSRTATHTSLILLTLFVLAFVAGARATEEPARVVAHITLPGTAVRQMFMQQHDGKQYLYLQQKAHFTDPKKPAVVERVLSQGSLQSIGHGLALTVAPEKGTPRESNAVSPQVVNVMDLSDPVHPRSIRIFNGVSSILPDDARKLIFITNNEGLWVLSHSQSYHLPLCTSEDAMDPDPDCQ